MKRKYLTVLFVLLFSFVLLCSCSKAQSNTDILGEYLGDYSYSDPAICMVYEPVEDEFDDNGEPYYGIQYREIKDLDGLLVSGNTMLLYFCSSMDNRSAEVTAAVEDIAQAYDGKLHVIMLDAIEHKELLEKYEIDAVPEFVLIRPGQASRVFNSSAYGYWTINDVVLWLQRNGIT